MANGNSLTLTKNTGITISIGLIIVLVVGIAGWVRSDTNLRRDLMELKHTTEKLGVSLEEMKDTLYEIKENSGERWSRKHMRKFVKECHSLNPNLKMPDVDEID